MKKDELFLKRIQTELLAELENIAKLMDEYSDFLFRYSGKMDVHLLRAKASFMADFYMGVEKIF